VIVMSALTMFAGVAISACAAVAAISSSQTDEDDIREAIVLRQVSDLGFEPFDLCLVIEGQPDASPDLLARLQRFFGAIPIRTGRACSDPSVSSLAITVSKIERTSPDTARATSDAQCPLHCGGSAKYDLVRKAEKWAISCTRRAPPQLSVTELQRGGPCAENSWTSRSAVIVRERLGPDFKVRVSDPRDSPLEVRVGLARPQASVLLDLRNHLRQPPALSMLVQQIQSSTTSLISAEVCLWVRAQDGILHSDCWSVMKPAFGPPLGVLE
jgi:hypothetical protein